MTKETRELERGVEEKTEKILKLSRRLEDIKNNTD